MGVAIPQVITEGKSLGSQFIEGSTRFNGETHASGYFTHIFRQQSAGTSSTFTVSLWFKKDRPMGNEFLFFSDHTNPSYGTGVGFNSSTGALRFYLASDTFSSRIYRDTNAWYHLVASANSGVWTAYVNGENINLSATSAASLGNTFRIGCIADASGSFYQGYMSQFYCVDGQALGPESFGFTDNITGEWRPKKYEGTYGSKGFYLPMDGKTNLSKDQSGNGNDFKLNGVEPGALTMRDATGGIPILKTNPSGLVGGAGPRTEKKVITVTVVSTDEGNKYFFDGVRYSPGTYPFYRGGVYRFDQSDASNGTGGTHPLRFATAADAAGSTEYTDGVTQTGTPGTAGAYTQIVVPHNAPDTLYYYCTNHGGMGGPTANTTDILVADPYAWKCLLAIPFTKTSQARPQDESNILRGEFTNSNAKAVVDSASMGHASYVKSRSNYYGQSVNFDSGTTSYYTVGSSGDFVFGTDDFCIECWVRLEDQGNGNASALFTTSTTSQNAGAGLFGFSNSSNQFGWCTDITGFTFLSANFTSYYSRWTHVAITRSGTDLRLFFNGRLMGSATDSVNYNYSSTMKLGQRWNNQDAYSLNGQIQDYRVYKGVAKYTEEFQVYHTKGSSSSTSPSGLSSAYRPLKEVTQGSLESGDTSTTNTGFGHVIYPNHSDFILSGDFTMECWVKTKRTKWKTTYTNYLASMGNTYSGTNSFYWYLDSVGRQGIYGNGGTLDGVGGGTYIEEVNREGMWNHYALTRKDGILRMFSNGFEVYEGGTSYTTTLQPESAGFIIASYFSGGETQNYTASTVGNISNFHIVNGTALYTKTFEVPSEPPQPHADTKLLTLNSPTSLTSGILPNFGTGTAYAMWPLNSDINDDSGNNRTLTENGGSTVFSAAGDNSYGITNAATFASGRYLSYAVAPATAWTIDCYIKPTALSSAPYVAGWNGTSGSNCSIGMDINPWNGGSGNGMSPSNVYTWAIFGSQNINTFKKVELNKWVHIRICSNDAKNINFYVDGEHIGGKGTDCSPASPITFGDVQSGRFQGQIAGFRYTEKNLGAPDVPEVTSNGVTTNSPIIRPCPNAGELSAVVSASSSNPFLEEDQLQGDGGGFATINGEAQVNSNGPQQINDGNLAFDLVSDSSLGYYRWFYSNMKLPSTGKWYWEMTRPGNDAVIDPTYSMPYVGIVDRIFGPTESTNSFQGKIVAISGNGFMYKYGYNSVWKINGYVSEPGGVFPYGSVMNFGFNADTGELKCWVNGVYFGIIDTVPTDKDWWPAATSVYNMNDYPHRFNFGQRAFNYPPPPGYKTLSLASIPRPTVPNPSENFKAVAWAGTGVNYTPIDVGFQPDFIWIKCRQPDALSHVLVDSSRGAAYLLESDTDDAEVNSSNFVRSIEPNGVKLGTNARVNAISSSRTYVGWFWKAGTGKVLNQDGNWNAQVNANRENGFSIITYDGAGGGMTIGHGLSKAPEFILFKLRTQAGGIDKEWAVYHHKANGGTTPEQYMGILDAANAFGAQSTFMNNTAVTDSIITLGSEQAVSYTGQPYVAYAWHSVDGFSKMGHYYGNNSTDGPVVETGFKPAWILIKRENNSNSWRVIDNARTPYNDGTTETLFADLNNTEDASFGVDFLSNGFKIRATASSLNADGDNFIYVAFAEVPSNPLFGAQPNAR
tara:strand:- start:882 stop:5843 length:4962 start_codon:yes stop_codon:yes gene_type:complete